MIEIICMFLFHFRLLEFSTVVFLLEMTYGVLTFWLILKDRKASC